MSNLKLDAVWKQEYVEEVAKMTDWDLLDEVIGQACTSSNDEHPWDWQMMACWKLDYVRPVLDQLLINKYGWPPLPEE